MELGLCLSFCNKRWKNPETLADFVDSLDIKKVMFSWDMVNPWWDEKRRNIISVNYAKEFRKRHIEIVTSFSGTAAYVYGNLLAGTELERNIGLDFFKRAIDVASVMEIPSIGTPAGCMCQEDLREERTYLKRREEMIDYIKELCCYGKEKGLREILLEPTPVRAEIPNTASDSLELMKQLKGETDIPIGLVLDWGHVLCPSFNGEPSDMEYWLDVCGPYVKACHLQQCDGIADCHWGFNNPGIVTTEMMRRVMKHPAAHVTQYLEYCPAFETSNEEVVQTVRNSLQYLRKIEV